MPNESNPYESPADTTIADPAPPVPSTGRLVLFTMCVIGGVSLLLTGRLLLLAILLVSLSEPYVLKTKAQRIAARKQNTDPRTGRRRSHPIGILAGMIMIVFMYGFLYDAIFDKVVFRSIVETFEFRVAALGVCVAACIWMVSRQWWRWWAHAAGDQPDRGT